MAFHRQNRREVIDRTVFCAVVTRLVAAELAATLTREADPFGIDHDCTNPMGHHFVALGNDVVCVQEGCGKVAWQCR
jgi:hypothetical protein